MACGTQATAIYSIFLYHLALCIPPVATVIIREFGAETKTCFAA